MEFVINLHNGAQKIRTSVYMTLTTSMWSPSGREKEIDGSANPSKTRLNVLRRDHFRCRKCGQAGDEITLEVLRTRPEDATIEAMITLCYPCRVSSNKRT